MCNGWHGRNHTVIENKLQGQIPGKDSSKWLSESYDKVKEFNNLAVQPGTKQYIVEFQMSDKYMKYLQDNAIPQKGSKGRDNVKFHYEGLEIDGPYKNYGIPESQRKLFNENIVKIITRSGKND